MLVKRLGERCSMVVLGDPQQVDTPHGTAPVVDLAETLSRAGIPKARSVRLDVTDVQRHPTVALLLPILDGFGRR